MCDNLIDGRLDSLACDIAKPFQIILNRLRVVNADVSKRLNEVEAPSASVHWHKLVCDFIKDNYEHKHEREVWRSLVCQLNNDGGRRNSVVMAALYWYLVLRAKNGDTTNVKDEVRRSCECRFSENCLFYDEFRELTRCLNETL